MNSQEKQIISAFLKKNVLATIATVNKKSSQPESALIAFAETDNLEIIFITQIGSRKYVNLLNNHRVALVIGLDKNNWITLQYEGTAHQITGHKATEYKQFFLKKEGSPCTDIFLSNPAMKFFKITPTWIGYSDFTGKKPLVIEIKKFKK